MPTFSGGTTGQAPLRLQLRTPAGLTARLYLVHAVGDTAAGSASRPVITRAGALGTGNSLITHPLAGATPSLATLSDTFSVGSSLPAMNVGPFALPIVAKWEAPRKAGIVVGDQGAAAALLLYANASGGHTWSATIHWEEL